MIVYTDRIQFAERCLSRTLGWNPFFSAQDRPGVGLLAEELLPSSLSYVAATDSDELWEHVFLLEHARHSQFDTLVRAVRNGVALPHGIVCVAGSGEGFHGLKNRAWVSLPGNIHLTAFVSPNQALSGLAGALSLLPAVAVIRTLDSLPGFEGVSGVKWVNDIVVGTSKVAGFLVQTQSLAGRITGAVIGIGLNVETSPRVVPTPFVPAAAALRDIVPDRRACTLPVVLQRLLHELARSYEEVVLGNSDALLQIYRERSVVVGKRVAVYEDTGVERGALLREGRVRSIGDHLELNLEGPGPAVYRGRLVVEPEGPQDRAGQSGGEETLCRTSPISGEGREYVVTGSS